MKLPKRDLPEYELKLPVADIEVKYRPYTIKEQKILMMAAQTNDQAEITKGVRQVIENCTNVNWDILCDADFEYLFTRLMSVSVSNVAQAEITYDCGEEGCPTIHPTAINLETIHVVNLDALEKKYKRKKNYWVVQFDETSGICMRQIMTTSSQEETIYKSTVSVYDENGVYDEFTQEELMEYIDGLTDEDFRKITEFINTQPYCTTTSNATCTKCGKGVTVDLKGVLDFFV